MDWISVAGFCEHGNELSVYIKCWEILSDCWLLKKNSAPRVS
jgi:hypothetical protein